MAPSSLRILLICATRANQPAEKQASLVIVNAADPFLLLAAHLVKSFFEALWRLSSLARIAKLESPVILGRSFRQMAEAKELYSCLLPSASGHKLPRCFSRKPGAA